MADTEDGKPREKQLHELLSRDMVDIYVGQNNTHWILHEKLLCYRSNFFRDVFYSKTSSEHKNSSFGLPDDDDEPFRLFVGWLYSGAVPTPSEEKDLGDLFDLYLMGEKWSIQGLVIDVLDAVRAFYKGHESYPGLRRVQYVYANTSQESPMRQLLVAAVARYLVLGKGMPTHWDKALRKNGQLAVDIILAVQRWGIREEEVPDVRDESVIPIAEEAAVKKEEEGESSAAGQTEDETLVNGVASGEDSDDTADDEGSTHKKLPNGTAGKEH